MPKRKPDGTAYFWGMARSYLHGYCAKERMLSSKTISTYREALECYIVFLRDVKDIERSDIGFEHFERAYAKEWIAWMNEVMNYAPKTVAVRLGGVRTFLYWCGGEDIELAALYTSIRMLKAPKIPKKPLDYLQNDELAAVLAAHEGDSAKSRRNRMLLIFLYETAARVSEVTDVTLEDVKLTKPAHVTLTGKGSKTRVVPLGEKCIAHLKVYLSEFYPAKRNARKPLFYSMHRGVETPLSTDTIAKVLKQAGQKATARCASVPEGIHCHQIRRTRAMDLYKSGVPLPLVMQLLGHEHMSTTSAFYAFATTEMMSKAVSAATPDIVSIDTGWLTEERKEALYSLR